MLGGVWGVLGGVWGVLGGVWGVGGLGGWGVEGVLAYVSLKNCSMT